MLQINIDDDLELRQLEILHAEALFALVDTNRAHLREWLPWVDSTQGVKDTRDFIQHCLDQSEADDGCSCGVWYRGALVGVIGVHYIDRAHRKSSLGYWLGAAGQGKGIMTRATRGMIDHLIGVEDVNRVEIGSAVENHKSRAVLTRLGANEEGIRRQTEWLYDHFVDHMIYSVLAEDWTIHADRAATGSK